MKFEIYCLYSTLLFIIYSLSELLVQALFRPDIIVNPEHKEKYVYLLAYATSVHEDSDEYSNVPIKDELMATQEAIETAHSICTSANDSHTELLTNMATLFTTLRLIISLIATYELQPW